MIIQIATILVVLSLFVYMREVVRILTNTLVSVKQKDTEEIKALSSSVEKLVSLMKDKSDNDARIVEILLDGVISRHLEEFMQVRRERELLKLDADRAKNVMHETAMMPIQTERKEEALTEQEKEFIFEEEIFNK